jgi:hypothetical protein
LTHPWPIDIAIVLVLRSYNEVEVAPHDKGVSTVLNLESQFLQELPSSGVVSRAIHKNSGPFDPEAAVVKVGTDEEPPFPPGPHLEAVIPGP